MNRTFGLPKPPQRLRRRAAAAPHTQPAVPVAAPFQSAAPGRRTVSQHPRSHHVTTDRLPIDWSRVDATSIDWAAIDWTAWSKDRGEAPESADDSAGDLVEIPVTVYGINEPTPGPRWKALFEATWPAYRSWYLRDGDGARPDLGAATAALRRHMPELVPTYERLVELAGGDDVAARMLTMWNAPAFLPACSQAVLPGPTPLLCRNYDYSPDLWEQTIYTSAFTGRKVIGTGDCLWGLLDGMNDAGLVVSLTFGGRPGAGAGFAIPLVVRYLLEVARTAGEARELLRGLPIAMSYNLTVVDAASAAFTAFVAPGQQVEFSESPVATNHHGLIPEFADRARSLRSVPRLDRLAELVAADPTPNELVAAFQADPLYNREYSRAFGTLYTALYRPAEGVVDYVWPDVTWRRGFDDGDGTRTVLLRGR
jgi:predicted choloylglycine hydrolase